MCGTGLVQCGAFQNLPQGHDHKLLNKDKDRAGEGQRHHAVTPRYWAVHRVAATTLNPEGGFLARQGHLPPPGLALGDPLKPAGQDWWGQPVPAGL